jgi:hypothetical protein
MKRNALISLGILGICVGCIDTADFIDHSSQAAKREEAMQDFEQAIRETEGLTPPIAVLKIEEVEGWEQSPMRSLPPEEHGFSVGYNHPLGITVTLYQYTRGITSIPNELDTPLIEDEMLGAKDGIQQLVDLGYYAKATETEHGKKKMGTSSQWAAWSRYSILADGNTITTDTYIWPVGNTIHKLRCTGQFQESSAEEAALGELLTAMGKASSSIK